MNEKAEENFKALVINDESPVGTLVTDVLRNEGWKVVRSPSAEDALIRLDEAPWSAVFCDLMLGGANGYSVLRHFKEKLPEAKVVLMMTDRGAEIGALDATAFGAYDYLLKSFGPDELQSLSQALREQLIEHPQRSSPTRRSAAYPSDIKLVGRSQAFLEVMKQVNRISRTDLPVLLTGEAGTGKELVALAIHHRSERAEHPFVIVHCDAIAPELIEAEIFGQTQGAGNDRDRRGLLEGIDGGTIFLDEITQTSASFQVRLLQELQTGEFKRVGSDETQRVNVRVIAATGRNVEQEVAAGRFRSELFYCLSSVSMALPPLRERPEDIPPLAQSLADRVYSLNPPVKFSAEALTLLERYDWPGNIRELENAVVRAVAMCDGTIRVKDLPERVRNYTQAKNDSATKEEWVPLSEIEGRYVAQVLTHTRGNKQAAARVLAVDRKTLDRMIKRHHIDSQSARRAGR